MNYVRVDVYPTVGGQPVADLVKADFEVLEDGVAQTVDSFEHVSVRPRDVTAERFEPQSVDEANRMAADARNRLFVVFLDTYHVTESSVLHNGEFRLPGSTTQRVPAPAGPLGTSAVTRALAGFLDRAIGSSDLFAVLTPETDADTLSFTRRPENFEDLVRTVWGRRFSWDDLDPEEERWTICYRPDDVNHCYPGVVLDMVRRHREMATIESLRRLVQKLGELREERKAVLLVSEGWALFRPDRQLARPLPRVSAPGCPADAPQGKGIYVGADGKVHAGTDPRTFMTVDWQQCESARSTIAHTDIERAYRDLMDQANRTNTSFYPIDPRGLAVVATPMDYKDLPQTPANLTTLPADKASLADSTDLRERLEALHNLATATDGTMTASNDLTGSMKKIADDLSEYYLLGYSSTNTKADGTFRKITIRVKRPGVAVRARRGYLAATEAELAARKAAAAPPDPEVAARDTALASLGAIRADRPFHLAAGTAWRTAPDGTSRQPIVWMTGELDIAAARETTWSSGGDVAISILGPEGKTVASEQAAVSATTRAFLVQSGARLAAGQYVVRAQLRGRMGETLAVTDQVRIAVPGPSAGAAGGLGQPLLFRRGPYSGAGFQPTADLRFRRAERVRVDIPVSAAIPEAEITARVLDRKGQPLPVPVATSSRAAAGVRFVSGEVALAPMAFGDYLLEVAVRQGDRLEKALAAIRIVP